MACRLNRTIPNLYVPENLILWRRLEAAKHRLVYSLIRLGVPLTNRFEDPEKGLAFDFMADNENSEDIVMTGHMTGAITINIAEADDAAREQLRSDLMEPYRTLLGHFRHESGHHYWERLVQGGVWHQAFRASFGDERRDYAAAIDAHYASGGQPDWQERYVSRYAASHPWEDFAETWAHYLHMVDTLETAAAFGVEVMPRVTSEAAFRTQIDFDPYRQIDFDSLAAAWLPLTAAVNNLNQSMGQPDLYPFVLSPQGQGKLRFVHGLVHA